MQLSIILFKFTEPEVYFELSEVRYTCKRSWFVFLNKKNGVIVEYVLQVLIDILILEGSK